MTVRRMDNVGIVVEDLDAAIAFFTELGFEPAEVFVKREPQLALRLLIGEHGAVHHAIVEEILAVLAQAEPVEDMSGLEDRINVAVQGRHSTAMGDVRDRRSARSTARARHRANAHRWPLTHRGSTNGHRTLCGRVRAPGAPVSQKTRTQQI